MRSLVALLLFLLSVSRHGAKGQVLLEHWWETNGQVHAMLNDTVAGRLYVGGQFTQAGPHFAFGVGVDPLIGQVTVTWPEINGRVHCSIADGNGGWYIGGEFTEVGGVPRDRIARLNADGSVHAWDPGANSTVGVLAKGLDVVYAAGGFSNVGGQTRSRLAALDTITGAATAWDPAPDALVNCLLVDGPMVYAGGEFMNIGGAARSRIAALDAITGNAVAWNIGVSGGSSPWVKTLFMTDSIIYVGGSFSSIGGQVRNGLAAIDRYLGTITAWAPNPNNSVYSIAATDSIVYVGGWFTTIGGQSRPRLAAIDASTGIATSWQPDPTGSIYELEIVGTALYVAGAFEHFLGSPRGNAAAVDIATGLLEPWNPMCGSTPTTITSSGSAIFLGGYFTVVNGVMRRNIMSFDPASGIATDWDPSADAAVYSLLQDGSRLIVGGSFTNMGGQSRSRICALDTATGVPTPWDPQADGAVNTLVIADSMLYVGGRFDSIGGQPHSRIARLDLLSGAPTAWDPTIISTSSYYGVLCIVPHDSLLYIGGTFPGVGGLSRSGAAALDRLTGIPTNWAPQVLGGVFCIVPDGPNVWLGGNFSAISGIVRSDIAQVDSVTGAPSGWDAQCSGISNTGVYAIVPGDSTILVAGSDYAYSGQTRYGLAELDRGTAAPTSFNPMFGRAFCLATDDLRLFVGGSSWMKAAGQVRTGICVFDLCPSDTYFTDSDGDGYGDPTSGTLQCVPPTAGFVTDSTDCDDSDAAIFIGAPCDDGSLGTINDSIDVYCACVGDLSTGASAMDRSTALMAWPSPTAETLHLNERIDGRILDAWGKEVMLVGNSMVIDLRSLPSGVYLLIARDGRIVRAIKY